MFPGRLKEFLRLEDDKTSEDAARGVIGAIRQQTWLTRFLIGKSILHAPEAEDPDIAATKRRLGGRDWCRLVG